MSDRLKSFRDISIHELLDHVPEFAEVTDTAKQKIAECCTKVSKRKDKALIEQGDSVTTAYILISGLVAVEQNPDRASEIGEEQELEEEADGARKEIYAYYGPGDSIALNALVSGKRSLFSFITRTPCYLLEISARFQEVVREHAGVPLNLWISGSDWVANYVDRREKRARLDKSQWMTLRLLEIAAAIEQRIVSNSERHTSYPFEITWWRRLEDAGNEVWLSRQTVSDIFGELRKADVMYGGEDGWREVELIGGCKSKLEKLIAEKLKKSK